MYILKNKSFGTLSEKHIYSDTQSIPGEVLYSDVLKLKGKPDYIIKKGDTYVPVEVKTGKTPTYPYKNHIMQLVAYCALVEGNYQKKVTHGVIKYPENEFQIEYTDARKRELADIINEMLDFIESGKEPQCNHPEHQISK